MTKDEISTREKILTVASALFAKNGFNGTSIRDIAKEADVNLAAISYHFGNKENLYREIFVMGYNKLDASINELAFDLSAYDLAWAIFQLMNERSAQLRNTFAMIISDNIPEVGEIAECNMCRAIPPGFAKLAKTIMHEYGPDIPIAGVFWCVTTIFTHLLQSTLMLNSEHFRNIRKSQNLQEVMLEEGIKHNIKATLQYMLANKTQFKHWPFLDGIEMMLKA